MNSKFFAVAGDSSSEDSEQEVEQKGGLCSLDLEEVKQPQ